MPIRQYLRVLDEDAMTSDSATAVATQQSLKAYVDARQFYGLTWDESADTYARTGILAGIAAGSSPGNAALPIQARVRRCIISDAGEVQYYLNPNDSTKKVDGSAADLTGADGQVMVEIPCFWYKYAYAGTTHRWDISKFPLPGFTRHPAFVKNGANVDFRYCGAYEGVLYDVSEGIYANGIYQTAFSCTFANADSSITANARTAPFIGLENGDKIAVSGTTNNNATFTVSSSGSNTIVIVSEALTDETAANTIIQAEKDWANDKLASVSAKRPINYGTRANFRAVAANRGTGWRQFDFYLASAIQLLYLVEYADFYSQSMIGNGLTDWASGTWSTYNDYNPINDNGLSNGDGDGINNVSGGDGVVGSYMTYRGIENWFGHIWKWVDGFNINNNIPYFSNTDTDFADDTNTNYDDPSVTLHNADGYQGALEQIDEGFLSADVTGTSTTKITDYYYQASGWRVALMGGGALDGAHAGAFYWYLTYASSDLHRSFGGRVSF